MPKNIKNEVPNGGLPTSKPHYQDFTRMQFSQGVVDNGTMFDSDTSSELFLRKMLKPKKSLKWSFSKLFVFAKWHLVLCPYATQIS